jgi:hypothetical protein
MKYCSIFFLKEKILISSMVESADGEMKWGLPFKLIKRDAAVSVMGEEVINILNSPASGIAAPGDILKETGFKNWDEFASSSAMITAELKCDKIVLYPYFSGIDGEFYAVLNREKSASMEPYEVGHVLIKCLEYCV